VTTTTKPPKRTPVTTPPPPAEPPASLSLDEMLARLFGDHPAGLLRLVAGHGGGADSEAFFQHGPTADGLGSRWTWPGAQGVDTPFKFSVRNADAETRWSPLLHTNPAAGGPVRVPVLWARFPNRLVPHPHAPGFCTVDPVSEAQSLAKVAGITPAPTIVLDSGVALTAFWALNRPITSTIYAENFLFRLAVLFAASREAAVVARSTTFAIPGAVMAGVIPRWTATATALGAGTVSTEDLDAIARA
jgi:hypothetical protein